MSSPVYDVVILGGGPAGCATGLALRRRGIERILIAEAKGYQEIRIGESIPPDSRVLLDRLGIWDDFAGDGHEPCLGSCSSWGDDALGYNDYLFNPHGTGWHLDRRRFDAFLASNAVGSGVELWANTRFDSGERTDKQRFALRLKAPDGTSHAVHARCVVDATGSRSLFARSMGARQLVHDQLSCVAAFLQLSAWSRLSRLTMLEAVEYGWWYAARLPDSRVAVAVASDPEIIKQTALHTRERWLACLSATNHLSFEVEGCSFAEDYLVVRPARSFVLDSASGDGWLAVGDAASAYDPISSQGIYKALLDGLQAADAITAYLGGDAAGLHQYRAAIAARFADYLRNRNYFYGVEQRWPSAPFWRRRRARADHQEYIGKDRGPSLDIPHERTLS